ncbi:XRE family transcriptional regulator [Actinoallomurus purpureus]|uniref:helix-turn-helix domain-containing protein n=1 Tax=Actinoallomurus purpureus TaxID=478114 RepID=UPI002093CDCC|nr:XRE family transcriptional regulator [Actinoallomurus purpureus]MCO6010490.1 XRE family transcriptional regulator [Actinoallomurus purpureus]
MATDESEPRGDRDSGSASDVRPRIGARLRRERRRRELTIEQLAQATGLTKGFLSQVERDRANVSVASLLRICEVLGVRVGDLFDDEESGLVPAADRPAMHFGGTGVRDFLLTPRANRSIQVLQSTVAPGGNSEDDGDPPYRTRSDAQFIHVTRGEFEITLDGEVFLLRAGDSLTFTGRENVKSWRNPSADEDAELLWMLTPSLF